MFFTVSSWWIVRRSGASVVPRAWEVENKMAADGQGQVRG